MIWRGWVGNCSKLWHQATLALEELVKDPCFNADGNKDLVTIYNELVKVSTSLSLRPALIVSRGVQQSCEQGDTLVYMYKCFVSQSFSTNLRTSQAAHSSAFNRALSKWTKTDVAPQDQPSSSTWPGFASRMNAVKHAGGRVLILRVPVCMYVCMYGRLSNVWAHFGRNSLVCLCMSLSLSVCVSLPFLCSHLCLLSGSFPQRFRSECRSSTGTRRQALMRPSLSLRCYCSPSCKSEIFPFLASVHVDIVNKPARIHTCGCYTRVGVTYT